MNASHDADVPGLSIVAGSLIPALVGGGIGIIVAFSTWAWPEIESSFRAFMWQLFAGLVVGGVPGLAVGFILSWHGGQIGVLRERAGFASLWGVVAGLTVGIACGPVFGGVIGLACGHFVSGMMLGLFFGPIAGVVAWEISFFTADTFAAD